MAIIKYSPKLPINLLEDSSIESITESLENTKQKLKTLILTNPGEKLMDRNFGVGVRKYLFETIREGNYLNFSKNDVNENVRRESILEIELQNIITRNVNNYLQEVSDVVVKVNESTEILNTINIVIYYRFNGFYQDSIEISIPGI